MSSLESTDDDKLAAQNQAKTKPNYFGVLAVSLVVVVFILFPTASVSIIARFTQLSIETFGLEIILFASVLVVLSLGISVSPIGKLILGGIDAKPEFGLFSWLAMLFTCGMGSGLVFWGIAEPVFHFSALETGTPAFGSVQGSGIDNALALTYFHWGIHAWSIYALAGLAIAWFSFNRGRSLHISASFTDKNNKSWFRLVDWLAIVAIIFGVAGTFANTIALIQTGLENTIAPNIGSVGFRYGLILCLALLATVSSILGLKRGIKKLSQFNTMMMLVMVTVVIMLFNPLDMVTRLFNSTITYLAILPEVSTSIPTDSVDWSLGWSVIYIVWWVAWAPFVAPFIARISRGRSVRQFLLSVVFVPTIASMIWFSAFGGIALEQSYAQELITAVNGDYTQGLFAFFGQVSIGQVLSLAAIILLVTFVITSADSALLVCGMLANDESKKGKLIWALMLSILSMALININDVDLNKQVAIAGAIPFALVMVAQIFVMLTDMIKELRS